MRLYLVNPDNPVVSLNKVHWNRLNTYRIWKPLGLLVVAGLTPPDWEVTLIDENLFRPDYGRLHKPDLVGVTAFTSQAPRAYEVAGMYRAKNRVPDDRAKNPERRRGRSHELSLDMAPPVSGSNSAW